VEGASADSPCCGCGCGRALSQIFYRNSQQADFEAAREHELRGVVLKMQCHARRFVVKCKYLRYRAILATIKDAIAARVLDRLEVCAGSRSAARRRP
jgi:hypothetical protein